MNILYLINYLGGGGTESYIYSLASKLKENNKIYLVYNEKADGYEKFKNLGVELIQLPMNNFYDFKAAKELNNLCKAKEIDIVHTHFLRENSIAVLSKFFGHKAKLINTRHMLLVNSGITKYVNKLITKYDDSIIAVSKAVENLLISELGSRKNIKLIYTGIDLDKYKGENYNFRQKYDIDEETLLITSTARFSPEKGHAFIINSLPQIIEKSPNKNIKFVFIGDGPILNDMKSLTKKLSVSDYVMFLGYQDDIKSILNGSNIYLLGSETEAFGISILEAMAYSLPVLSTNSGGTSEIIPTNSDYGILIDYNDETQLVNSVLKLIEDENLRQFYGDKGYNLVLDKFSLDKTIDETYSLYQK